MHPAKQKWALFIENRHEQLFQRFLRDRNALRFGSRIQRTIEHIESNLLEKLIVLSPEQDNITESDFQHQLKINQILAKSSKPPDVDIAARSSKTARTPPPSQRGANRLSDDEDQFD